MVEFREIDEVEWDRMPQPKPAKPPNQWDELLGAVESGKIVVIDVPQEKLRGTRIGIARSASARHTMKVAFRYQDGHLAIRRSETPVVSKETTGTMGRKPRTHKSDVEG